MVSVATSWSDGEEIPITTDDHKIWSRRFLSGKFPLKKMSTSKRKHSSPPPASSSPKKRKHKYKSSSHTKSSHVESSASSTATSLFQKSRLKIHIAVPPAAVESLDTYLQSHLTSTLLLKHTAEGTIVAFSGFKSLDGAGRVLDECPFAWSWFEGEVVLFNPRIGQRIRTISKVRR